MSFLQNLAPELLKIALLAAVYAIAIYSVRFIVPGRIRQKWFRPIKYWHIFLATGAALFIYSFTYYGKHGLGNSYYLPLGYHKAVVAADSYAFFRTNDSAPAMSVDSFLVRHDELCMQSGGYYYICHLPTGELKKFNNKTGYEQYASQHSLPAAGSFLDFKSQYDHYWHGWRKWVLP
jgi:hypothetical protein